MTVWVVTVVSSCCVFCCARKRQGRFHGTVPAGSELRRDTRNVLGVIPDEGLATGDKFAANCV